MTGFSEKALTARRASTKLRAADVTQYTRRQIIACVEHWRQSGKSIDQLLFRLRTMPLAAPSQDSTRDDARIARIEAGVESPHLDPELSERK